MASFFSKQKRSKRRTAGREPAVGLGPATVEVAIDTGASCAGDDKEAGEGNAIPGVTSDPAGSKKAPATLLEKLAALHGRRARLKRLCAEALRLVLESFGVEKGALLVYDPHRQSLVLAAERGLGKTAKQRLRCVRRSDPRSWDMPLHGLLNERAYLIDDPAENRYVPPLIDAGNHKLVRVACVPIYRQRSPVGAFVLLAEADRRLTEPEIRISYVSLRYVAMIIDETREREGMNAFAGSEDQDASEAQTDAPVAKSPRAAARAKRHHRLPHEIPASPELQTARDTASGKIDLTEVVESPEATTEGLEPRGGATLDTVEALEARDREALSEILRLREELARVSGDLQRRAGDSEEERDRALGALRAELGEDHERVLAAVRAELGEEHERALAAVRAERDELSARLASLTESFESAQSELQAQAASSARLRDLESELASTRDAASEAAQQLQAAKTEIDAHKSRIGELEANCSRLEAETAAVREQIALVRARGESADTLPAARGTEIAGSSGQLAATDVGVDASGRTIDESRTSNEQMKARWAAVLEELARSSEHARSLQAAIELRNAEAPELTTELSAVRAIDEANSRATEALKATASCFEADRAALAEQSQSLETEVRALREGVAAHEHMARELRLEIESAGGDNRAAAERERLLHDTLERAHSEWQAREARWTEEIEALRAEREEIANRLTNAEASLRESSSALDARAAAEAAAQSELARLKDDQVAGRQEAEHLRQEAGDLAGKIAGLEQAVQEATAHAREIEERETKAPQEAEQLRQEAGKLAGEVAGLEQALHESTARAREIEERETKARQEVLQWREEGGRLTEKVARLEQALHESTARAREMEERESTVRREAERWRAETESLSTAVSALSEKVQMAEAEAARWQEATKVLDQRAAAATDQEMVAARLESERRAAYADAARAREEAAESERRSQDFKSQRDEQAKRAATLEAAVVRLEAELSIHSQQRSRTGTQGKAEVGVPSGSSAVKSGGSSRDFPEEAAAEGAARAQKERSKAATAAGDSKATSSERFVIVEPSADTGNALAGRLGANALVIPVAGDVATMVRAVEEARPTIVIINLGSRGSASGFQVLEALRHSKTHAAARVWAYVAPPQATKALALGFIRQLSQPVESKRLVELLSGLCGRGGRVLSVGLEMDGLLSVRAELAKEGISLSMALDSKQGHELLDMVNPGAVVVDLDLPRGDGYRTLGRLAGTRSRHTWVLCGSVTPPAEAGSLVVTGATQGSAAAFLAMADIGTALLEDLKLQAETVPDVPSGKARQRSRERTAEPAGHGRNAGPPNAAGTSGPARPTGSGIRRATGAGSQRRSPNT